MKTRLLRDERGFTLTEMLVTMMIMIIVLFALYGIFDMSIRVFQFGNNKVEAVENARLGLEKMEREIRAAYPVDKITPAPNRKDYVFFNPGVPGTAALPGQRSITFGNDLPDPPVAANRRIVDPATGATEPGEEITYALTGPGAGGVCPAPDPANPGVTCTLVRSENNGVSQAVVEYVRPDGLTLTYFRPDGSAVNPANNGRDVGIVRIKLEIKKKDSAQTLTTDVDLRNR